MGKKEYFYTWLISLLTLVISVNTGSPLAFFLFVIISTTLILSFLYPLITYNYVKIKKIHIKPNKIYKNQKATIYIRIKNQSLLPILFAKISISSEFFLPIKEQIIINLKPLQEIDIELQVLAIQRGHIKKLIIIIQQILLFKILKPLKVEVETSVYIYPNFGTIPNTIISRIVPEENLSSYYKLSEEGEFFSIRDYQLDDIKKIAWKQWAKTGRLVVKQKAQFIKQNINIIINNLQTTKEQDEEFIEKLNTLLKNIILSNTEIILSTLDKIDSPKKINKLHSSLTYLSELVFIKQTNNIKNLDKKLNIENSKTFIVSHKDQPQIQFSNAEYITI